MQDLNGKMLSGTLYGRKYGSTEALQHLGNVTKLVTSKKIEKDELKSTGIDDFGEAIAVHIKPSATEIEMNFNSFDKNGMARALMGEAVDLSKQVQSFENEALIASTNWIKLAHGDIDPAHFVLKDEQQRVIDASTYTLNARIGMIRFNESSQVLAGSTIKATGKTKGSAGYQIDSHSLQSLPLELYLDGKDLITGKYYTLTIPHVVLASEGGIDWFSDKWVENGLKGTVIKDHDKAAMLYREFA